MAWTGAVVLDLPYPPTANNLFRNVAKGRVRTTAYNNWIALAMLTLAGQRPTSITGPYLLTITATRPDRRARDIDNLIKPVSDLLRKAGVIEADHLATSVTARWLASEPVKGGGCRVIVAPDYSDQMEAA